LRAVSAHAEAGADIVVDRQLGLRIAISVVAVLAAGIAAFEDAIGITVSAAVLGLLTLAALPWLASLLQSAELPGGWKLEFRRLESEQQRQRADLDLLRFLISGFVTDAELMHLQKLAARAPFPFVRGPETSYFLNELRRLRSLGLIENAPGKGVRVLEREGGDLGSYFSVTPRGREYLRLRAEAGDADRD
jgi:hypothetical protein